MNLKINQMNNEFNAKEAEKARAFQLDMWNMKMASGQIRMTPDTMRGRAGEYRTEAENVQNVIDKMDRLLDTLLTEWEGAASEAYANKFAELRPSFVKGKELIDDIAMALDKTAEAVESTDTQIANQFSM